MASKTIFQLLIFASVAITVKLISPLVLVQETELNRNDDSVKIQVSTNCTISASDLGWQKVCVVLKAEAGALIRVSRTVYGSPVKQVQIVKLDSPSKNFSVLFRGDTIEHSLDTISDMFGERSFSALPNSKTFGLSYSKNDNTVELKLSDQTIDNPSLFQIGWTLEYVSEKDTISEFPEIEKTMKKADAFTFQKTVLIEDK